MKEKYSKFFYSDKGETFKDFIFGFQDGLISTYVLLAGIAILVFNKPALVLITLLAEVAAGAISMGFGAYISTKTKNEFLIKLGHNNNNLKSNKLREFYRKKELNENEIEIIENLSETHPNLWNKLDILSIEDSLKRDPVNNALYMSIAFVIGGILPVAPYFIPTPTWSFIIATILSFSALVIVGIFRSFYSEKHWLKPVLEMILIGILAIIIIEIYLYFITMSYGMILIR